MIFRLIQEATNKDFKRYENFLNVYFLGYFLKNHHDFDLDENFVHFYNFQTNPHNISTVSLGSGGLENDDGISCYAGWPLECLLG